MRRKSGGEVRWAPADDEPARGGAAAEAQAAGPGDARDEQPAEEPSPGGGSPEPARGDGADLQSNHSQAVTEEAPSIPLEQHQRLLAEFDNYRKRVEAQQERSARWARAELLARLLPLLDDFDRARRALIEHPRRDDREGTLIILGRLAEALKREGLEPIAASPGTAFDPEVHEAVLAVPSADVPAGSIAEVLQTGYRAGDRLLRPARVTVARAPESDAADGGDPPD